MSKGVLAQPLALPCGAVLPNRLAKAAMTEGLATGAGMATPELERLYAIWGRGGAGLLITGNVVIDPLHRERPGNVVIAGEPSSEALAALERIARAAEAGGAEIWMQISHAGRQTPAIVNPRPKAPSAVPLGLPGKQFGAPVALTEDEIEAIIAGFARAASIAKRAGFDGVQVHAAHGYLISQFLSPRANVRTDQWGVSLENRARLLMRTVRAVREAVGADFAVAAKLNSADFQKGGFAFDESLTVAKWLEEAGIDLIEISGGSYEQPKMMDMDGLEAAEQPRVAASTAKREAYFVDFAKAMRADLKVPLMVTGGFRTRAAMEHALETGACDMVGLGRPLCADPDAAAKLLGGAEALERWETRLNLLPAPLRWLKRFDMVRAIDGFATQYWYYGQLYALGRTGAADPGLSVRAGWSEVERTHKSLMAKG